MFSFKFQIQMGKTIVAITPTKSAARKRTAHARRGNLHATTGSVSTTRWCATRSPTVRMNQMSLCTATWTNAPRWRCTNADINALTRSRVITATATRAINCWLTERRAPTLMNAWRSREAVHSTARTRLAATTANVTSATTSVRTTNTPASGRTRNSRG